MWVFVTAMLMVTVAGFEYTDEAYHRMPKLFHLDDWEECVSKNGAFCVGTFDLMPYENEQLLDHLKNFSNSKYHFNHSLIHRGLCLSTTCHVSDVSPRAFNQCVSNLTRTQYGLEANLTDLKYCKVGDNSRPVDDWDLTFAYITGLILLMNLMGTAYDLMRNKDEKPIKQLTAWSLVANWERLTADYSDGDLRLSALKPIQGVKSLTLCLVLLAHSVFAFHNTYIHNPQFLEKSSQFVLSSYLQNGTSIVQTFIMISTFLLAYNLLIHVADNPKKQLSLKMLPQCLSHRIVRIAPLYLFIVGLSTTWWAHASDGPLWKPLIQDEVDRCRAQWWTHVLFVNNLVRFDGLCLIHTWFLAVDMQLYVFCVILTLVLGRWPRAAAKVLGVMIFGTILVDFAIIYSFKLKPMLILIMPEAMRTGFSKEFPSFTWLYTAPWTSLPAALAGLLMAFVIHLQQVDEYQPAKSTLIRILYRLSVPGMFAWVVGGHLVQDVTDPLAMSLYATFDRPVFIACTGFAMYGFINKIDSLWWKLLSWRGWEILGRMALSTYLVHWPLTLLLLAQRTNTNMTSIFDVGSHWLATIFLTYWAALPLHLLIELPTTRFLQSFTS